MNYFRVCNWERFQHYKDRSPPWIKLYTWVLEKYEFTELPDDSKAHLLLIWILSSRLKNRLPWNPKWIAKQISATRPVNLERLATAGFIELEQDASAMLATSKQDARPERETEERRGRDREEAEADTSVGQGPTNAQNGGPAVSDFDQFKEAYPKRSGSQPWTRAAKAANARIKAGWTFADLLLAAQRYKAFCDATGKTGTEFVMQAASFLGPELHFAEPWDLPDTRSPNAKAADEAKRILREMDRGRS